MQGCPGRCSFTCYSGWLEKPPGDGRGPAGCVCVGSSDLTVQMETSVSGGSGETPPQALCSEHLPAPHDFISPLTPLPPLWTCVPKPGGLSWLLTSGHLVLAQRACGSAGGFPLPFLFGRREVPAVRGELICPFHVMSAWGAPQGVAGPGEGQRTLSLFPRLQPDPPREVRSREPGLPAAGLWSWWGPCGWFWTQLWASQGPAAAAVMLPLLGETRGQRWESCSVESDLGCRRELVTSTHGVS